MTPGQPPPTFWPLDDQIEIQGPMLERSVNVRFVGDIGMANFHRMAGWLVMEVAARSGPYTKTAVLNGDGFVQSVRQVARGDAEFAIVTPASFATMALRGIGPYEGEAMPDLRAVAVVGHEDRLLLALDSKYGITKLSELRHVKPPFTVASAPDTGTNHVGMAVTAMLNAVGVSRADIERWGGRFAYHDYPMQCADMAYAGRADGLWHEAIMGGHWQRYLERASVSLVSIDDDVLSVVEDRFGWRRKSLPASYFPGHEAEIDTLDFSGYLILTRADVPEDLVEVVAWALIHRASMLEHLYAHIPPERRAVVFPLTHEVFNVQGIELHSGAARVASAEAK